MSSIVFIQIHLHVVECHYYCSFKRYYIHEEIAANNRYSQEGFEPLNMWFNISAEKISIFMCIWLSWAFLQSIISHSILWNEGLFQSGSLGLGSVTVRSHFQWTKFYWTKDGCRSLECNAIPLECLLSIILNNQLNMVNI